MELAVEVTDRLFVDLSHLAEERFGHTSDTGIGRLVAEALALWAEGTNVAAKENDEWEEPAANWEAGADEPSGESEKSILSWLFRRGG